MPFCPECGKNVSLTAKFCRNCGASQTEEQVAQPPPENPVCASCKTPLLPDDKFCSNCGQTTAQPSPAVPLAPSKEMPKSPPVPVCASCGAEITPGIKFCGSCGAPAGAPAPASQPAVPTAPAGYSCSACGSQLSGSEKFCGICGQPAVGSKPPAAPASPAGKFCGSCGAPVSETTKFCGGCGAPVGASFPAAAVIASPKPAAGVTATEERVLGVIPNARKMKMLGASWDTYTIVVTERRMIFALLTQQMLNAAIAEANAKGRAEGKGFLSIMGDQLAASFGYGRRYEMISPEEALKETPGNLAIENSRITGIALKLIETKNPGLDWHEIRMTIQSSDGKFEYIIAEDDRFTTLLQTAYGERVKMPFGLFSAGPVRVKFF